MNICIVDRGGAIPALKYGGTERVIYGLGKELHQMGHKITFLVPEGSTSDFAQIIILNREKDLNQQIPENIDFVHLNYKPDIPVVKPYLITMHGNPAPEEEIDKNTVFISKNQAERYNSEVYVLNGLDWNDYPTPNLKKKRDGFHFLGKASWKVKNALGAIKIARDIKERIHIIGGKRWNERMIKSGFRYLFSSKIHFHGFLNNEEKTKIMESSKGLIFPVLWHEPFGLAVIESLYAGCAIFATPNGALEELITSEVGFTGNSVHEISEAIKTFKYNPQKCHNYAVQNFNSRKMALQYTNLYEKVMTGNSLNEQAPTYNKGKNKVLKFT